MERKKLYYCFYLLVSITVGFASAARQLKNDGQHEPSIFMKASMDSVVNMVGCLSQHVFGTHAGYFRTTEAVHMSVFDQSRCG